jgi:hypothetical protein
LRVVFGWSGQAAEPAATVASEKVVVWGVLGWIQNYRRNSPRPGALPN